MSREFVAMRGHVHSAEKQEEAVQQYRPGYAVSFGFSSAVKPMLREEPLQDSPVELIDYRSEVTPRAFSFVERFTHGSITVSRCILPPNPGVRLGSGQFRLIIHDDAPYDLEWRLSESDALHTHSFRTGEQQILPPDTVAFRRWSRPVRVLTIAIERHFIEQAVTEAFEGQRPEIPAIIGMRDSVVEAMVPVWTKELAETGAAGRLFSEGLGVTLAMHLFRTYGDRQVPLQPIKGGLGALRRHRVIDYIEANFSDDVSLARLSKVAGLSLAHFGNAFKESLGKPPHHYLTERRIEHAKELLLGSQRPITDIALEVGFTTHSHFTVNFRKITGTTPSRFRMDHA